MNITRWRTLCGITALLLIIMMSATVAASPIRASMASEASGPDVTIVQQLLTDAGFSPGQADGVFGPMTKSAVIGFQRDCGIEPDGIVGPITLAHLERTRVTASRDTRETAKPLAGRTIVLDPGHGGPGGARGPGGSWEDDNVLAIGKYARDLLVQAGATVILTREGRDRPRDPTKPSAAQLEARVRIANRTGADVFVSIHNNANVSRVYRGMATYYRAADGQRTKDLAIAMQRALVNETGLKDIGLFTANFYVLRNASMTSVVTEIGFISNPVEEKLLLTDEFRRKAALGIYRGLLSFYRVNEPELPSRGDARPEPSTPSAGRPLIYGYWAQWGSEPEPYKSLAANVGMMDMVSPYWYTALADGMLRSRESNHDRIEKLVRDKGKKLIVMINNDKTASGRMLTDATARKRLVDNVVKLVTDRKFDGVNIDFENLRPEHRGPLTALVADIAKQLRPAGKLTTIAVGAKWSTDESTNDWAVCYDYRELSRHADYLIVMAYDQHGLWRGPGPVASIDWAEQVAQYSASQADPKKVLLGVAAYGYDWVGGKVQRNLTADEAVRLAGRMGADIIWNDTAQAPMFRYTKGGVRHEVWFENSYSGSHKMRLVSKYGLAGIALWKIGYEDQRLWEVARVELGLR